MEPNALEIWLEKYPDEAWDWRGISKNPNITMDIIEKYPNKPWDWWWISQNPNITMDIIEKYPNKAWSWWGISRNPFNPLNKAIKEWKEKIREVNDEIKFSPHIGGSEYNKLKNEI